MWGNIILLELIAMLKKIKASVLITKADSLYSGALKIASMRSEDNISKKLLSQLANG